jgi:hypothetical protein
MAGEWAERRRTVYKAAGGPQPNLAVEPTPNSLRSCVATAIGRGSPLAFGVKGTSVEW